MTSRIFNDTQARTGTVLISADQVPSVQGPLAVLRLSPQKPPMEFLQQVLRPNKRSLLAVPPAAEEVFGGQHRIDELTQAEEL